MAALSLFKLGRQLTFASRRLFSGASGKVRRSVELFHLNVAFDYVNMALAR